MAIVNMPVEYLVPHPQNPRKDLGDISELVDSIKNNGIYQNLTAVPLNEKDDADNPQYMVIIGHRRLAAAKQAGLKEVPCVIKRGMSEADQLRTMLMENMQRTDLTVYEQAQGFQQLLDFGMDIERISQESGFSESTIRRRLKIAELDQDKLKKVSNERQLNLSDFEKLNKIESLDERNRVLESIGTKDFSFNVNKAIRFEKTEKNLPFFQAAMKEQQAKQIKRSDRFSSKFKEIETVYLSEWDKWKEKIPKPKDGLYYYQSFDVVEFYHKAKKIKVEKEVVNPKQLELQKKISQKVTQIKQMSDNHYKLRSDFINNLYVGKNNIYVYVGAFMANMIMSLNYKSVNRKELTELCGLDYSRYNDEEKILAAVLSFISKAEAKDELKAVYYLFGDNKKESFTDIPPENTCMRTTPKYKNNSKLTMLYMWLKKLGYKMSEEEEQMMNGTHPIFEQEA